MNYIKKTVYFVLIAIVFVPTTLFSPIFAQTTTPTSVNSTDAKLAIKEKYDQLCSSRYGNDSQYQILYKDLLVAQQYDIDNPQPGNGNAAALKSTSDLLQAGCPPSVKDIAFVILRVVTLMITFFGLVVFFIIMQSAINILTAQGNKEKIKKGYGGLQSAITGTVLVLLAYTLIVFIAVRLGLSGDPEKFSLLDGPNLVFKFIFDY